MNIGYTSSKTSEAVVSARAKNLNAEDKARLKKAALDFQALLINQMLQSMRETEFTDEEDANSGYGNDTMSSMFDAELSTNLSKNSRFGLAEMLYENLTGEKLYETSSSVKKQTNESKSISTETTKESVSQSSSSTEVATETATIINKNKVLNYSTNVFDVINKYDSIIESSAESQNVDPVLVKAVIAAESNGNPNAVSQAKAKGLMQLIDGTAKSMGVKNVFNPTDNINGGTKYLSTLLEKYDGNVKYALAAYNAGPGAVDKYSGVPPYKETQNYVTKVLNYYSIMKEKQQEVAVNE
jgi:soluble lytic murein transglycosylase-like protein